MDLVGLFVFSVSMAIFGAYQAIPLGNNRPDAGFPFRLRDEFGLGYIFGRVNEATSVFAPSDKPTETYNATSSVYSGTVTTPLAGSVEPTSIFTGNSSALPGTATDTETDSRLLSLTAELVKELRLTACGWVQRGSNFGCRAMPWIKPSLPSGFDGTVYLGLSCFFAAVVGATLLFGLNIHRACKEIGARFVRKTTNTIGKIDLMLADTIHRKERFVECLDSLDDTMTQLVRQIEKAITQKQKDVDKVLTSVDVLLDSTNRRARQVTDAILNGVNKLENQHGPFSTTEDFMGNLVTTLKATMKTAQDELKAEIRDVKAMIPALKSTSNQFPEQLREDSQTDCVKAFEFETQRLEKAVMQMRRAIDSCMPDGKVDHLLKELVRDYKSVDELADKTRIRIRQAGWAMRKMTEVDMKNLEEKLRINQRALFGLAGELKESAEFINASRELNGQMVQTAAEYNAELEEDVSELEEEEEEKEKKKKKEKEVRMYSEMTTAFLIKEAMGTAFGPQRPSQTEVEQEAQTDAEREAQEDADEEDNGEESDNDYDHDPRPPMLHKPSGSRSSRENRIYPDFYYDCSPSVSRGRRHGDNALLTHPFRPIHPTPPIYHYADTTSDSSSSFNDCAIDSEQSQFSEQGT